MRCAICGEPHPGVFGAVCRSCRGESPYLRGPGLSFSGPDLTRIPVSEAVGRVALHDMTRIEPGVSKGPAVIAGQTISGGDLCRLQLMGRNSIYVEDKAVSPNWVHENEVAEAFREDMPGDGVDASDDIREGKISFRAARQGVFWVDETRLREFNLVPEVICATRHCGSMVGEGAPLAFRPGHTAVPCPRKLSACPRSPGRRGRCFPSCRCAAAPSGVSHHRDGSVSGAD